MILFKGLRWFLNWYFEPFYQVDYSFIKVYWKKITHKFALYNYLRKYIMKKYFYTINHKRLGLNYFYFAFFTAMSGSVLATAIRLEMAFPGSSFFNGDSLKYLQVITAHALIMIFFVVVPIFFGGFANFLLPYHVGSKDVAFPRLNSLGFWIQPCGYLLIAKIGFIRTEYWFAHDKIVNYLDLSKGANYTTSYEYYLAETLPNYAAFNMSSEAALKEEFDKLNLILLEKGGSPMQRIADSSIDISAEFIGKAFNYDSRILRMYEEFQNVSIMTNLTGFSWKLALWKEFYAMPESIWFLVSQARYWKRRKRFLVKCANATQTVAGWTFITPFSSKLKFTGAGVQDMLVLGVYFAGISTTISLVNLLATRRCLTMSGLRNRRILLSFTSISILLMFRALAVITPILGSAMLMLVLDRHWQTSFFDFAYGGDPIFFHHLFWFFGHPEVYVLVIPAFGLINAVLPITNYRRVASKHHLIWAIYIMNYMGFLVWGHHMYLIGLDHRSRALYSTITIMISMPATIKVVNWTYTLVNGALKKDAVLISSISFIFFFLVAGFTGMWLSHVSLNISMHDTLYVVAHFHLMLSGSVVMAIFVGFYFYFNTFLNIKFSRTLAYTHITYYTGGQWLTFLPLFWVSFSGLPRRLHDYPAIFMGWQGLSTVGHFLTMLGVFSFYATILESHLEKKLGVYFHTIIARFNKRAIYYLYKIIFNQYTSKTLKYIPNFFVRDCHKTVAY